MAYLNLKNFGGGLDGRNYKLSQPAGTVTALTNAHITPGAEIEKRKAFVKQERPGQTVGSATTSLPAGTFGLQPVATGLMVFGSSDLAGESYPRPFSFQRLRHPAVYPTAYVAYDATKHAMTELVFSTVFGGRAFAAAKFADGYTFCFWDGLIVSDFIAGLILPALAGDNTKIAQAMTALINATTNYTAAQAGAVVSAVGLPGSTYGINQNNTSLAGVATATLLDDGIDLVTGMPAVGQFTLKAGSNNAANTISAVTIGATYARGLLTSDGTNVSNNDTVTINAKTYTFKTVLTPAEGEILIGSTAENTLRNLIAAINHTGVPNTDYKCAAIHPDFRAVDSQLGGVVTIVARVAGTAANAYATTEASTHLAWGAATATGGTASTSLLPAAVLWTDTPSVTASLVASAINSNTPSTGFSASASAGTVYITSATNSLSNGATVSVTATGDVCIGDCAMTFAHVGTGTTNVTSIRVNGIAITSATVNWTTNLATTIAAVATNIRAAGTGYNAYASGANLFISKSTTASDDAPANVTATFSDGNITVAALGNTPISVRLTLTTAMIGRGVIDPARAGRGYLPLPSPSVSCRASGGVGPYTYFWTRVAGSDTNIIVGSGGANFAAGASSTLQTVVFRYNGYLPGGKVSEMRTAQFICTVTDSLGTTLTSAPISVFAG